MATRAACPEAHCRVVLGKYLLMNLKTHIYHDALTCTMIFLVTKPLPEPILVYCNNLDPHQQTEVNSESKYQYILSRKCN